jgi:beta-catenin-like protein 1
MPWLLSRIKAKTWDDNRGYASEMLAILLQENRENRLELGKQNGVDILLQVLSVSNLIISARLQ